MSAGAGTKDDVLAPCAVGELTSFTLAGGLGIARSSPAPRRTLNDELPHTLCARYQLEGVLGAGGMGVVYRARDLLHEQFGEPDAYVAVKLLGDDFSEAPDAGALLYSEFALTRHLRHPNVIRVDQFDIDLDYQRVFIVQELMRGNTLEEILCKQPTGLPYDQLATIATSLLDALAYAHERSVLHGDIKPGNLMLTEDGPRIFDFGLGLAMGGTLSTLPRLSRERFKAWTPSYAAPELLAGAGLSKSTDVFAMGCVLYELACGKHPFNRMLSTQAFNERRWHALLPPDNLPICAWPALREALALDVKKRTISAPELHEAFCIASTGRGKSRFASCLSRGRKFRDLLSAYLT